VDKYGWVDIGSSFLPSEIIAAFLAAQLEHLDSIQQKRMQIWNQYDQLLEPLKQNGKIQGPCIPEYATNNAHMYYIVCNSLEERTALIGEMKQNEIIPVFHYQSLHRSQYYKGRHDGRALPFADRYTDCLLRLPMYYELSESDVNRVSETLLKFYRHV